MMKRRLLLLLAGAVSAAKLFAGCTDSCSCEYTSKSYLWVRPHFLPAAPEMVAGFRNDRVRARGEEGHCGAFQAVIYGSKSNNWKNLARYFMPDCKRCLTVDSRLTDGEFGLSRNPGNIIEKDLLAANFNIFTDPDITDPGVISDGKFRSRIWFEPEQTVVGLGLHWVQDVWVFEESGRAIWAAVNFPIERVRNTMGLCEEVIETDPVDKSGDVKVVANMREAFIQDEWEYGKICSGSMSRTGIADVNVRLGLKWLAHRPVHMDTYAGVLIPTGNKPDGRYLFEPVVGNGHRWGFMWGSAFGVDVMNRGEDGINLRFEIAPNNMYMFSQKYCRQVDLKNKPWSRYMAMYENKEQAQKAYDDYLAGSTANDDNAQRRARNLATPGVNILTLPLRVKGGFQHNITSSFVLTCPTSCGGFQAEAGYNFFCRNAECVELACPWKAGPALKSHWSPYWLPGETNPIGDITGRFELEQARWRNNGGCAPTAPPNPQQCVNAQWGLDDYDKAMITAEDLDLNSAAAPLVFTQTIYGSAGFRCDTCEHPLFVNLGGSYEMSQSNAMLERWTVWFKGGVSF